MSFSSTLQTLTYAGLSLLTGLFLSCTASPIVVNPAASTVTSSGVRATPNHGVVTQPTVTTTAPAVVARPAAPAVTAAAAIVYDPRTGRVLFDKNAHQRRAVASTQKLMTALLATEHGLNKMVTVPQAATNVVPSKLYLKPGTRYKMADLVEAMLIRSGNDVAYTAGYGVAGSNAGFIQMMNNRARSLGMYNSNFMNAHGLTETGQYSTAYDIALLGATAYRSNFIRSCASKQETTFTYADGRTKHLTNTNKLLKRVSFCDGLKTGTTNASGKCLVSSGTYNGQTRIVVVLGASNTENLLKDSEVLLRWGMTQ